MKKIPFSHSKARLFGTLNRNDIKIRISIFFACCNDSGKSGTRKTKEWEIGPFFFSLTLFSHPYPSSSNPKNRGSSPLGNSVVFPRPKWFSSSELGIKFKWKLDGIPGEEIGLWEIWIAIERGGRKRDCI